MRNTKFLVNMGSEISIWLEPLDEHLTRVQILSRPLVPFNIIDYGSNRRYVNRVVELFRTHHAIVAEG